MELTDEFLFKKEGEGRLVFMKVHMDKLFSKRLQGMLLFEFMLVLIVLTVLLPVVFSVFKQSINGIKKSKFSQQRIAENMEIFSRLMVDSIGMNRYVSDCCVTTDAHDICYDIRGHRFRRRRRRLGSIYFYSIYLGNLKRWDRLTCSSTNNVLKMILYEENNAQEFLFYLNSK